MFSLKNSLFLLTVLSAITCGLMAGVFFAFSTFVMKALARIPVQEAITAMQSVNFVVPESLFGIAFILTPLICLITMISGFFRSDSPANYYILAGGFIYLITNLLVTLVFNIPLNNLLAEIQTSAPNAGEIWSNYLNDWNFWNHVRTVGAIISTILFMLALR